MENLKNIKVTGEVSLRPYPLDCPQDSEITPVALILGPTGAGKSSFVEALAGSSHSLSLSSNGLAGYTQQISGFIVTNATVRGSRLCVIDTPGFSDSKFSEKEILDMVNGWLHHKELSDVRIMYLVPINGTRLPGTKRKTLEMLKTFLASWGANLEYLTFVTTMWDTLYTEGALGRGQSNFEQLQNNQLKDFIDDGAKIAKFKNTASSALQVLDECTLQAGHFTNFPGKQFRSPQLYRDLYERIEQALLEKRIIEDDLAQLEAQTNLNLRNILKRNQRNNEEVLTKFIRQFNDYGDPPQGWEDMAEGLHQKIDAITSRSGPVQSILLSDLGTNTADQSPSGQAGGQAPTPPSVDVINHSPVVESEPGQRERTPIETVMRHASVRTSLREMPRRTLEGAIRPFKKWFGPKR